MTQFEEKFAQFVGSKYAISTSGCAGALQIALTALDIGPGDEVIVPDVTWLQLQMLLDIWELPIFLDIEIDSWNMDIKDSVKSLTTDNTQNNHACSYVVIQQGWTKLYLMQKKRIT